MGCFGSKRNAGSTSPTLPPAKSPEGEAKSENSPSKEKMDGYTGKEGSIAGVGNQVSGGHEGGDRDGGSGGEDVCGDDDGVKDGGEFGNGANNGDAGDSHGDNGYQSEPETALWRVYKQLSHETLQRFNPYEKEVERCFQEERCAKSLGYASVVTTEQIEGSLRKDADTKLPIFQTAFCFPAICAKTLYEVSELIPNRQKWDSGGSLTVIQKSNEDDFRLHTVIDGMMMVDGRDFIERVIRLADDDAGIYIVFKKSVEDDEVQMTKKFVRAVTHFQMTVIYRTSESGCAVHMISCTDFGGNLPKKVIMHQAKNQPAKWLKQVSRAVKKYETGKL